MSLLDERARLRVEEAVRLAEETTSGELVVALTPRADSYALVRGLASFALAIASCAEFAHRFDGLDSSFYFAAQVPLATTLYWLTGRSWLVRTLVPQRLRRFAVRQRALAAFVELGVVETRERSGILLFLSECERSVELIADRGIYERVAPDYFNGVVSRLTDALRAGRAEEGLLAMVSELGVLLAKEFPPSEENVDELPNQVRLV